MSKIVPDWTKVYPREYRVQFRFLIDCPPHYTDKGRFFYHYMPRWSVFITQIMQTRLSKTDIRDTLPRIRDALPLKVKLEQIYPLLNSHQPGLARCLLDASLVFDLSPHELKSHIVTAFGVKPDSLQEYLESKNAA
jgi:hypothetical protein